VIIELGLRYRMCDIHSKVEEDRTKTVVAIVDGYIMLTRIQTDRQTNIRSIDLYMSNATRCIRQTNEITERNGVGESILHGTNIYSNIYTVFVILDIC